MDNLDKKIIVYLGRTPDFLNEVFLQDDGQGAYIKELNEKDKAKPTDEQLNALESEATKLEKKTRTLQNRTARAYARQKTELEPGEKTAKYNRLADQLDKLRKASEGK